MKRAGSSGYNNAGPKKQRSFEEEGPSFEDELGMMDQMDFEVIEGVDASEGENLEARWARGANSDPLDSTKDSLAFHWLDIDMTSGDPLESNPDGTDVIGSTEGPVPIIRMYGVTAQGLSVMANVHGFTPYFYVSFPTSLELSDNMLGQLRASLDQKVKKTFYLYYNIYIYPYLTSIYN